MPIWLHNFIHAGEFSIVERLTILALATYILVSIYSYLT